MNNFFKNSSFRTSLNLLLVIIISITFYKFVDNIAVLLKTLALFLKSTLRVLSPFIYGFCFAYLLNPAVKFVENYLSEKTKIFEKKPRYPRYVSMVFVYILTFVLIFLTFNFLLPEIFTNINPLINQISTIGLNLKKYIDEIAKNLTEINPDLAKEIYDLTVVPITDKVQDIPEIIVALIDNTKQITNTLINFTLGIVISIYVLLEKETLSKLLVKTLHAFLKEEKVNSILSFFSIANKIFYNYIIATVIDSLIVGVLSFIVLYIIKMPFATVISIIVGITNVIPYFGPFIGGIPAVILVLFINPTQAIILAVFIFILQQIDGNILKPILMGESTGLSAFWVIFAIMIGGAVLGPLGMFIAVPVFALIKTFLGEYIDERLKKKNLKELVDE